MTESTIDNSDAEAPSAGGPGTRLRVAREHLGMSIAQAANELRLTERQVSALEADEYEALPPAPFVRGYLRGYARLLQIDADAVVAAFDEVTGERSAAQPMTREEEGGRHRFPSWLALLVLLALASGGAAAWWYWGDMPLPAAATDTVDSTDASAEGETVESADAGVESVAPDGPDDATDELAVASDDQPAIIDPDLLTIEPGAPAEEIQQRDAEVGAAFEQIPADDADVPDAQAPDVASAEPEAGGGELAEATADPGAASEEADDAVADAAQEGPDRLTLRVDGETWIEVHDDRGRRLVYSLYTGDDSLNVRGWAPFEVFLGNGPAVAVEYAGEAVDIGPFIRANDTARFRVDAEGAHGP